MNSKRLIVGVLALSAVLATGLAQAHTDGDVQWRVTIGAPADMPVYGARTEAWVPIRYGQDVYRQPTRWDRDGDGIPNRYDRLYNPRWDRDGDGIADRYEHRDHRRHDRDGDGDRGDYGHGWRR